MSYIIHCPIKGTIEFEPGDLEELKPLIEHLSSNLVVTKETSFPRGTILPDGRLDLCKQNVGYQGQQTLVKFKYFIQIAKYFCHRL